MEVQPAHPRDDDATLMALRAALPWTVAALRRRQANLLDDKLIDRFVAVGWLKWAGGSLLPTEQGRVIAEGASQGLAGR